MELKLAFCSIACPDWTLAQITENSRSMGFDGVQLCVHKDGSHIHPDMSVGEARKVGEQFRGAGVAIAGLWAFTSFMHSDDAELAKNQAQMRTLIAQAEAMGALSIRTYGGHIPAGANRDAMDQKMANALKPLAREAHERGVKIGLYTHDEWVSGKRNHQMIELVGSPGLGTVYDVSAAHARSGESWEVTYQQIKDHLCYTLLSDRYVGPDEKPHFVSLGSGEVPLREMVKGLKSGGYGSHLSYIWEKKWMRNLADPEEMLPHYVYWIRREWKAADVKSGK